jgi:glycosyltransferase involved in cell wall biosynthesis
MEYIVSFIASAILVAKARRRGRFSVIQSCNPPDIFWPIAVLLRFIDHTYFVFDHHDLCPELYRSRYPNGHRAPYLVLLVLERITQKRADHVVATNDSYRQVAIARNGKDPSDVTVVRSGPELKKLHRLPADPSLRRDRNHLVAYIGVMGPQDGVDIAVRAANVIVREWGRRDVSFTLMGSGDCFDELVQLRNKLNLQEFVEFTGRAPDELVARVLSTADIGLSPDPKNPLNDLSTMNKTLEYMAYGLPTVAFDLHETRFSAANAAVYAEPNEIEGFAKAIVDLLDDDIRRTEMGNIAIERIRGELAWDHQSPTYVNVFHSLVGDRRSQPKLPLFSHHSTVEVQIEVT